MSLHQLVIRNLIVLEQAPEIAEEVDRAVLDAIFDQIQQWVAQRPNWWTDGEYTYDNSYAFRFGAGNWPREGDEPKAWYRLASTNNDYTYFLSALTRAVPYEFGFWFQVDAAWITNLIGRGARPRAAWQSFLAQQLINKIALETAGFEMIEGSLFLPIHLDVEKVAEAYPETLRDALLPVAGILEKLKDVQADIDEILKAAEKQFFPS